MITELERRALMGDPAAQQECTEKGIVLGCPHCGQKGEIHESETAEKTCGRKMFLKMRELQDYLALEAKKRVTFTKKKPLLLGVQKILPR